MAQKGKTVIRGTLEVPQAVTNEQAVNLGQVKDLIDRRMKEPARVATTTELAGTYADGVLTLDGSADIIDNVSLQLEDAVLVKDQIDKTQNGVYIVTNLGTPGIPSTATATIGASTGITNVTVNKTIYETILQTGETFTYVDADTTWKDSSSNAVVLADYGIVTEGTAADGDTITIAYNAGTPGTGGELTRREDFAETKKILNNIFINVMEGATNADTRWTIVSDGVLTVGTSSFIFVKDIDVASGSVNVVKANITGDGVTAAFNIAHNCNLSDAYAYLLIIRDGAGNNVYVDDEPTLGNEANSLTLNFGSAPLATEAFKVYILGLE